MSVNAAFVTLLTKDAYLPGALVVDACMKAVGSKYPFVVLATPTLSQEVRDVLKRRNVPIREIQGLYPQEGAHSLAAHDERFADTWTKLRAFELIEYDRVVMMDSDMIVTRNMDELMTLDLPSGWIAATHACACNPRKLAHYPKDWVPENCAYTPLTHPEALTTASAITPSSPRPYGLLNSGLVVLTPSLELSRSIVDYLNTSPLVATFSFPDQDLLAEYFRGKWQPLPYIYNALKTLRVIHKPLWRDEEVKCLHYILHDKPWHARVGEPGSGGEYEVVNRWWWERFEALVDELAASDPEAHGLVLANVAK
ncbi:nucleotide-diphospho-sugar transferase [Artomyces pyxidatus]|uniref:Nucleotide-diphospho-sugar transferase n=1 Tax=Artomyces pyxidatus TaxID=48021 RepID=A0ACB8TIY2_9AGAM|nr:nucleotide-diphospho-sugar transferase [Artomyces pyxidatus]